MSSTGNDPEPDVAAAMEQGYAAMAANHARDDERRELRRRHVERTLGEEAEDSDHEHLDLDEQESARSARRDEFIAEFVEKRRDVLDRLAEGPTGEQKKQSREEILKRIADEDRGVLDRLRDS